MLLRRIPPMLPLFFFLALGIIIADHFPRIGEFFSHFSILHFLILSICLGTLLMPTIAENLNWGAARRLYEYRDKACFVYRFHRLLWQVFYGGRYFIAVGLKSLFFLILGYTLGFFTFHPTYPDNHVIHFIDQGPCLITGKIVSEPELLWKRVRCEFEVIAILFEDGGERIPITGTIRMNIYSPERDFSKGEYLQARGKIKGFRNFNNPGGFNYVRHMTLKGLLGQISVNGKKVRLLNSSEHALLGNGRDASNSSHVRPTDTTKHESPVNSKDKDFHINPHGLRPTTNHESPDIAMPINSFQIKNGEGSVSSAMERSISMVGWIVRSGRDILTTVARSLSEIRRQFGEKIQKDVENEDAAAILTALTTGRKDLISDALRHTFSVTGASHILAISGLHLSIIAFLFYYLFYLTLSLSTQLLISGWGRKLALLLTLLPLLAYAVLSGWSPATQRAMIMISVFIVAALVDRESDNVNSLAVAGGLILMLEPSALYSVSFQLSFCAVLFIIAGHALRGRLLTLFWLSFHSIRFFLFGKRHAPSYGQKKQHHIGKIVIKPSLNMLWVSLCAILGTQMLVMHYFHLISFAGIFTNLFLIPMVGFAALPLGLTALLSSPILPRLSTVLIQLAGKILDWTIQWIEWVSKIPHSWMETIIPDNVEMGSYYIAMFLFFTILKQDRIYGVIPRRLFAAGGIFLIFIAGYEGWALYKRFFNPDLEVTVLSVGQGNAAVISLPMGKRVLVDGGGFSYFSRFDTGEHIIAPFLRQNKILTLDAVIMTHPESDHLNGLVYILKHFKVLRLIKNRDERATYAYKDLMRAVTDKAVTVLHPDPLPPLSFYTLKFGNALLHFYLPFSFEDATPFNYNDNSLTFKLVFGHTSFFFPGDIMVEGETALGRHYSGMLKSDILMAPHHGSKTSSSDLLLDQVAPEAVIISCGWKNRFGFPHRSVVVNYQKRGITQYRTDLQGAITLISNGSRWDIF